MSERYTMRTATYEPTLYMDNGSILSDEQVLDLLNQLSTVTAQRDAAVEALKQIANELAAIHPYPDNPGLMEWPVTGEADALCLHTAYDTAKAAIAAAGEAP